MKRTLLACGIFALSGLVGPLVRFLTWPPEKFEELTSASMSEFVYHLVILLWPTQPMAVIEVNIGTLLAGTIAISANVLWFSVIGLVAGIGAKRFSWLIACYVVVSGLVLLVALWGSGFDFEFFDVPAFTVALLIYAIPFWMVHRFASPA